MGRQITPAVSVIMPAYNAEKYIEEAIRSVLNQTFSDLELLVIDDGSKDGTIELVSKLAKEDDRIRLLTNEKNMGVAETRNRGLKASKGNYIALLDSDDGWYAAKLEKQLALAKETGADLIYTSYALISEKGEKSYNDYIIPPETNLKKQLVQNVIGCSTVMFTREIADKYRFDENFYHEDYVLWLKLLRDGYKAAGVTECVSYYRVMETSRSSDKTSSAKKRWRIYREFLGYSFIKSAYYFARYAIAGLMKYNLSGK